MNSGIVKTAVDYAVRKRNFAVSSNGNDANPALPEAITDHVLYANIDIERSNEDDRIRPHNLVLGVAERQSNIADLMDLACGKLVLPKEIIVHTLLGNSERVIARRVFTDLKLRIANSHYTKLHGSSEEMSITRLIFSCYLQDAEPVVVCN
ncbi:hypothetical protein D3C80_710960 [compost metagenome]